MRAQNLVPMHPQSSWDISELGTWTVWCSCQGFRNTTGAVTALPWVVVKMGRGKRDPASVPDWVAWSLCSPVYMCVSEVLVVSGVAKHASRCIRLWVAFTYSAVASGGKQMHASLKAHSVDRSIRELSFLLVTVWTDPVLCVQYAQGKSGMMHAPLSSDGATECAAVQVLASWFSNSLVLFYFYTNTAL